MSNAIASKNGKMTYDSRHQELHSSFFFPPFLLANVPNEISLLKIHFAKQSDWRNGRKYISPHFTLKKYEIFKGTKKVNETSTHFQKKLFYPCTENACFQNRLSNVKSALHRRQPPLLSSFSPPAGRQCDQFKTISYQPLLFGVKNVQFVCKVLILRNKIPK